MRAAEAAEAAAVQAFFDGLQAGLWERVRGEAALAVVERDGVLWATLCAPGLLQLPEALQAEALAAGLPIGTLEEGFNLDLQGALEAGLAGAVRRQAVRVNEKASRLFLYHRDILGDSVLEYDPRLQQGDHCLVLNPRREVMGIGQVVGRFKGKTSAVRAIHDLGAYLREQDAGET